MISCFWLWFLFGLALAEDMTDGEMAYLGAVSNRTKVCFSISMSWILFRVESSWRSLRAITQSNLRIGTLSTSSCPSSKREAFISLPVGHGTQTPLLSVLARYLGVFASSTWDGSHCNITEEHCTKPSHFYVISTCNVLHTLEREREI